MNARRNIAWRRLAWLAISIGASFWLATAFSEKLANTADVLGVIAAIFSILAGVLIAVISILGDPSMIMDQSWRHSYLNAQETQRKLHRNTDTFLLYVAILVALFVYMLCDPAASWFWIAQRVTFFLVALGFFASMSLPFYLKAIQRQRLDDAITAKKAEVATRQNGGG